MGKPSKAAKTLSYRQAASLRLAQLAKVAGVMRDAGEILDAGPWLKVLANTLSAAPAGPIGKRRGRNAPDQWELSYTTLLVAAQRCGLEVSEDDIEQQVLDTGAWRHKESQRLGRPHYAQMRADKIGELLGITDEVRREARADNIGTFGGSPKARAEARRERSKLHKEKRRREAGAMPQSQSLSRLKPWQAEGISRTTWYERRREEGDDNGTDPNAGNAAKKGAAREGQAAGRTRSASGGSKAAEPIPKPTEAVGGRGNIEVDVVSPPQGGGRDAGDGHSGQFRNHQIRPDNFGAGQFREHQISESRTTSGAPIIPHGLRPLECPEHPASAHVETEKTATSSRGGPEVDANPPGGAEADRRQDIEAAIARFRAMKGEPAPPYRMEPGGIAARALALVKAPSPLAVLEVL